MIICPNLWPFNWGKNICSKLNHWISHDVHPEDSGEEWPKKAFEGPVEHIRPRGSDQTALIAETLDDLDGWMSVYVIHCSG